MITWIDLETSGLDAHLDCVLEFGLMITDDSLAVKYMNSWVVEPVVPFEWWVPLVQEMHSKSGLLADINDGPVRPFAEVEKEVVAAIDQYGAENSPLAGNTCYHDRHFLEHWMPGVLRMLHYRSIDVSSIKELCERWYPKVFDMRPHKDDKPHRAMPDLMHSLEELRYYRSMVFTEVGSV